MFGTWLWNVYLFLNIYGCQYRINDNIIIDIISILLKLGVKNGDNFVNILKS